MYVRTGTCSDNDECKRDMMRVHNSFTGHFFCLTLRLRLSLEPHTRENVAWSVYCSHLQGWLGHLLLPASFSPVDPA